MAAEKAKGTLGFVGVTVNAMALIAPGAFLWVTFGVQAATGMGDQTFGTDMWFGVVLALVVAFSTAFPYAELARRYHEAGCGGAYYFADMGFKDTQLGESVQKHRRAAKLIIGWSSHLFYWVYPGVMTAFQATLVGYIIEQMSNSPGSLPIGVYPVICLFMALGVGYFCYIGVTGSTAVAVLINFVQLTMLVILSGFFFYFRATGGGSLEIQEDEWVYPSAGDVLGPKSFVGVLFQASVAILILVGFDSATSLSGDCANPARDVPRGVIASLAIQGCFAYLLEYWAANAALSNRLVGEGGIYGMDAAGASSAPIGDLSVQVVNALCGSGGKAFMIFLAFTVAMAVFGSTLAAMNTAVRFSQAMAEDGELPKVFCMLSAKNTPYMGIAIQVFVTFCIGSIGACGGSVTLLAVTLASNLGTFVLYTFVCVVTIVAFKNTDEENPLLQFYMPLLGIFLNLLMVGSIFVIGLMSGGDTTLATIIAICLAALWTALILPYWMLKGPSSCEVQEFKGELSVVPGEPTKCAPPNVNPPILP